MHHKVSDEGKRACRAALASAMRHITGIHTAGLIQILMVAVDVFAEFHGRGPDESDPDVLKRMIREYGRGNKMAEDIMKRMNWTWEPEEPKH